MTVDEIETIAKQVLSEYKLTSIADIVALKDKLKLDTVMKSVKHKAALIKITRFS
jgi:hypothetical protein